MGTATRQSRKKPTVGLYWRKLVSFVFIFVFLLVAILNIKSFSADTTNYSPDTTTKDLSVNVVITGDGSISVDNEKLSERIDTTGSNDEMILPILDNAGIAYTNFTATVTLPSDVLAKSSYEMKAIHGVGSTNIKVTDNHTLVYSATSVSAMATVSLILRMPKGTVTPPLAIKIYSTLSGMKSNFWVVIGLALPILTLFIMFGFVLIQRKNQKIEQPDKETNSPPMSLPPAIVGVLYNQKVRSREIAATLIDLALRGDIYILDRERDFAFAKNRFDQRLLSFEKILLSKIFKDNVVSNKEEIDQRINNHMYSRKVSLVTSGIYVIATRLGYFRVNPQKVYFKYRVYGIGGFFVGLTGFVLSLLYFTNPPYIAFFWVGMMVSAIIIILVSKKIPTRTPLGREELTNWLAFRKYLSNPAKIPFSYDNQELFQKFLPYAIVMDCEVAWAKRFSEQNFVLPDWYVSQQTSLSLEDFCLSLFPLVSYVARSLAAIKEPGFE